MIVDRQDKCFIEEELKSNNSYFKYNETHYKACSKEIMNCEECTSARYCTKCINNFYFVNDNNTYCVNKNEIIPEDEFYKLDNENYYSCGYKKVIDNCLKCDNMTTCKLCKENYALKSDNLNTCYLKSVLEIGHYPNDEKTIYSPCIRNCDTCSNGQKCEKCSIGYSLIEENTFCANCEIEKNDIVQELNEENINSLVNKYINSNKDRLDVVNHYINKNNLFTITIFKSWECTEDLLYQKYFSLNTKELTLTLNNSAKIPKNELTYYLITNNGKSILEIYHNTLRKKIDIGTSCLECKNSKFEINNNFTKEIEEVIGNLAIKEIREENIDIFKRKDDCYESVCKRFTIEGIDIPINERRKHYYLGYKDKEVICTDENCEIKSKSINTL